LKCGAKITDNFCYAIRSHSRATANQIWFVRLRIKFAWIVVIKFLLLTYHHSHFLATTLDFTSFFTMAFLRAAHCFYSLAVFGLDFTSFCTLQSWRITNNGWLLLLVFFFYVGSAPHVYHAYFLVKIYTFCIYQWLQVN